MPVAALRRLVDTLEASGRFVLPAGELSIVFLDATAMGLLHAAFLDDPAPTDVITFDGDPLLGSAGEICVCPDVAASYAQAHRLDFARELALYIAHGYLHLAGFDDTSAEVRRRMRQAEREAMAAVSAAQAIPPATFTS